MKQRLAFISLLLLSSWIVVNAQEAPHFTAAAPSSVIIDQPFQLVFTINASAKDLRVPEFTNFDVLAGPFESHSSSVQIINGKTTSSVAVSYTYTLQAKKTGTFSITPASIMVSGQKIVSNGLSIKVLPADATSRPKDNATQRSSASSISNDNIFVRAEASKTSVYEQEAVLVTYKLYTLVDVVQLAKAKLPDFNGFLKHDIDQNKNAQLSYENYKGKNYGVIVLTQALLYPQHSGVIEIGKANFDVVIRVQNRAQVRSIFDDFFDSYTNVTKSITAPSVKIEVKPLPASKPLSFAGTVGRFSMSSSITKSKLKANEAVTIKVEISGSGNIKLIKNPEFKFPEGFETYDPNVVNNFKTTTSGVSGTKTIEYLFIPKHSGTYEIPAAEFSYFDTHDHVYKTLRSNSFKLEVAKGEGAETNMAQTSVSYVDKEDVKLLAKDIRFIKTNKYELIREEVPYFGSVTYWIAYLIPLLISLLLFSMFRKQAIENADLLLVKNKRANKVAKKRLKYADKLLKQGKKDLFYEEVLKALWTYLSDKLSIPVASLTKDSVQDELSTLGVDLDLLEKLMSILSTCEFARYAPNTGQQEMGNLYEDTISVISKLEETIRKS